MYDKSQTRKSTDFGSLKILSKWSLILEQEVKNLILIEQRWLINHKLIGSAKEQN